MTESAPFSVGDSADASRSQAWVEFTQRVEGYVRGEVFPFTLEIKDPLANSFIGGLGDLSPDEDPGLTVVDYPRTWDEDEELGLHDIDVDDYGEDRPDTNPHLALTHQRWGPDHPHECGKGCDDDAPPPADFEPRPSDDQRQFQPCEQFDGAREGFVFTTGSRGLGYYEDISKKL